MKDEYEGIPAPTLEALKRYVNHRCPTGGFLEAVLSNDLRRALGVVDRDNLLVLKEIVMWVYCKCPCEAQGACENYRAWIAGFNPAALKEKNNE